LSNLGPGEGKTLRPIGDIYPLENSMNKDQVKGRVEEAKGKVKKITGKITGDKALERKGKVEEIAGKAQAQYGDVKRDFTKGS
jgi:uncharacterized protein YjbJ (UPF0337 family)